MKKRKKRPSEHPSSVASKDWRSPTLIQDRAALLDFKKEARLFLRTLPRLRKRKHVALIKKLAEGIEFRKGTRAVFAVPVRVTESQLVRALSSWIRSAEESGSAAIVIFLNDDCTLSKERFKAHLSVRLKEVESLQTRIRVFPRFHHFEGRARMGTIRGVLTDSICVAADRGNSGDLIVISNDADQISASRNYVRRVLRLMTEFKQMDAAEGALTWGDPEARLKMPEIVLHELLMKYADFRPNRAFLGELPAIHGWGANSFFRLSTYCAVGGYDFNRVTGEDIDLLRRIEIARVLGTGHFHGFFGRNVRLFPDLEIATDARRIVRCALEEETPFSHRSSHLGVRLGSLDDTSAYRARRILFQESDARKACAGRALSIRKLGERIRALYRVYARDFSARPDVASSVVAQIGEEFRDVYSKHIKDSSRKGRSK